MIDAATLAVSTCALTISAIALYTPRRNRKPTTAQRDFLRRVTLAVEAVEEAQELATVAASPQPRGPGGKFAARRDRGGAVSHEQGDAR